MKAILEKVGAKTPLRAELAGDWLDCGNADRQAASHQALLQKRSFNELTIDPVLGTITKKSRNVEKFIDEINYLRLLPHDLAVLFPRVVDFLGRLGLALRHSRVLRLPLARRSVRLRERRPRRVGAHLRSPESDRRRQVHGPHPAARRRRRCSRCSSARRERDSSAWRARPSS